MRLLIVSNVFSPYSSGGSAVIAKLQADWLSQHGIEVKIISLDNHKKKSSNSKIDFITTENKFSFFDLNKKNIWQRLRFHQLDLLLNKQLQKKVQEFSPDWIMTHNLTGLGWGSVANIQKKYPTIKWAHFLHDVQAFEPSGQIYYKENFKFIKNIWRNYWAKQRQQVFGEPDLIISPSQWLINVHQKYNFFTNSEKIVLPNPISDKGYQGTTSTQKGFIYVGRLSVDKGIKFLLSTLHNLPEVKIKFIGDGPLATEVKNMSDHNPNWTYLGSLSNTEVLNQMRYSQTLIMPSLIMENQPTVILEALLNNLDVIATNVGGVKEMLDGYGQIVEPDNILELQQAIQKSIKCKPNKSLQQQILQKHDIDHVMRNFLNYLLKA